VVLEDVMREELDALIGVGWGESSPKCIVFRHRHRPGASPRVQQAVGVSTKRPLKDYCSDITQRGGAFGSLEKGRSCHCAAFSGLQ
jgi:hypothetical protein